MQNICLLFARHPLVTRATHLCLIHAVIFQPSHFDDRTVRRKIAHLYTFLSLLANSSQKIIKKSTFCETCLFVHYLLTHLSCFEVHFRYLFLRFKESLPIYSISHYYESLITENCYSGGRKLVSSLVERKDVSFILTIFPKNFWNKWYLIWKP